MRVRRDVAAKFFHHGMLGLLQGLSIYSILKFDEAVERIHGVIDEIAWMAYEPGSRPQSQH